MHIKRIQFCLTNTLGALETLFTLRLQFSHWIILIIYTSLFEFIHFTPLTRTPGGCLFLSHKKKGSDGPKYSGSSQTIPECSEMFRNNLVRFRTFKNILEYSTILQTISGCSEMLWNALQNIRMFWSVQTFLKNETSKSYICMEGDSELPHHTTPLIVLGSFLNFYKYTIYI